MPEDLNKKDNEAKKNSYLYYIREICEKINKMGKMITSRVSFQRKLEDGLKYSSGWWWWGVVFSIHESVSFIAFELLYNSASCRKLTVMQIIFVHKDAANCIQ